MCRDLTGPVTGGTVNIRLSCDSHCGLKEAVKGQCFLMPLPTTKLSDFISLLIRLSYFRGWIHWRCCITHVHARRVIIHISFPEHATSADQTRACTCTCARARAGLCYVSSSAIGGCKTHLNQRKTPSGVWHTKPLGSSPYMSCPTVTVAH